MKIKYWLLLLVASIGCKEKYVAKVNRPPAGNLVVEGFIDAGDSATIISLSRTTQLDSARIIAETGAEVSIQSSGGQSFPLSEIDAGRYTAGAIPVDLSQQYRIYIKTSGKEYMSDYEEAKLSPPIDSVSWNADENGAAISVSTHDDLKKSLYYEWDYQETWQYSTPFTTEYILLGRGIVPRKPNQLIPQTCWSSDLSTNILVSSSDKLSLDQIYHFPITQVDYTLEKLQVRYSILVNQHVLTKDWYEWPQKIKNNTEQLGSIFDAQPSDVVGNIHCLTDPGELVIGFVGCTSTAQKRIFISSSEIPNHITSNGFAACTQKSFPWYLDRSYYSLEGSTLEITGVLRKIDSITQLMPVDTISTVFAAPTGCVDCRLHGGTGTQPDFWIP